MEDLAIPLTDDELNRLDAFLMERLSEEEENSDTNRGVMDICELDGFFTALVSGPEHVTPSQWLPVIWGDYEPNWETLGDMGDVVGLMIRHMNGIANALLHYPEEFQPLFFEQKIGSQYYTIVDEWCQGYAKGVGLSAQAWQAADKEVRNMLIPIFTFVGQEAWDKLDAMQGEQVDALQRLIPPAVKNIYLWWLERRPLCKKRDARQADSGPHETAQKETDNNNILDFTRARERLSQVKRHDVCPCGSGKQYDSCCLH